MYSVYLRAAAMRFSLLAAVWWSLSEGLRESWSVGLPLVAAALVASLWLQPPRPTRWTVAGLIRFAGFFLWGSLRGGADVALRAVRPMMPIDPLLMRYPLRLPAGPPQALFRVTLSLMPGSLGTHMEGEDLIVHFMVGSPAAVLRELQTLEAQVARLFNVGPTRDTEHA